MSDRSRKSASIPQWQQAHDTEAERTSNNTSSPTAPETTSTSSPSQENELLEKARDFLKDASIKDAPRDQKISFLKSKGIPTEEIENLLGNQEDEDQSLKTVHDTSEPREEKRTNLTPHETIQGSSTALPANDLAAQDERPTEMPPIITYPEFLLKPQKPPPLITVSRLVNAAYAIAGVSALTWGASKYLVQPMLESLTEARHNFAEGTLEDLEKLNTKLETSVSHVPYIDNTAVPKKPHEKDGEDDVNSIDSDPTELFHRDIATQTTPGLSRSTSNLSDDSNKRNDVTANQASRLASLHAQLASLAQSTNMAVDKNSSLNETIKNFQTQLDGLESAYSSFANQHYSGIGNLYSNSVNDATKNVSTPTNTEAVKFKAEIRSLKGAFLSSRNFPTAPRATNTPSYGVR